MGQGEEKFELLLKKNRLVVSTKPGHYQLIDNINLVEKYWYHIAFTVTKKKLGSSPFKIYINGVETKTIGISFPNFLITEGFIGSQSPKNRYLVRQGIFYLFQEPLTSYDTCSLYAIGPNYSGYFRGLYGNCELNVLPDLITADHARILNLDLSLLWSGIQPQIKIQFDITTILLGYSAKFFKTFKHKEKFKFSLLNCSPSSDPAATLNGEAFPLKSNELCSCLRSVCDGGILYCFDIIQKGRKFDEIKCGLSLMLRALHGDNWNTNVMTERKGFYALSHILKVKAQKGLVNSEVIEEIFAFIGLEEPSVLLNGRSNINIRLNLLPIIMPYYVWKYCPLETQRSYYGCVLQLFPRLNEYKNIIPDKLVKHILNALLFPPTQVSYNLHLLPDLFKCLTLLLKVTKGELVLNGIATFITSTLSENFGGQNIKRNLATKFIISENSVGLIRNSFLQYILELNEYDCPTDIFLNVITLDWVFTFITPKRGSFTALIGLQLYHKLTMLSQDKSFHSSSISLGINLPVGSGVRQDMSGRLYVYELLMLTWSLPIHCVDTKQEKPLDRIFNYLTKVKTQPLLGFLFSLFQYMNRWYLSLIENVSLNTVRFRSQLFDFFKTLFDYLSNNFVKEITTLMLKEKNLLYSLLDILYSQFQYDNVEIASGSIRRSRSKSLSNAKESKSKRTFSIDQCEGIAVFERNKVSKSVIIYLQQLIVASSEMASSENILSLIFSYFPIIEGASNASIIQIHAEIIQDLCNNLVTYCKLFNISQLHKVIYTASFQTLLYTCVPPSITIGEIYQKSYFPNGLNNVLVMILKYTKLYSNSKIKLQNSPVFGPDKKMLIDLLISYFSECKDSGKTSDIELSRQIDLIAPKYIFPFLTKNQMSLILYFFLTFIPDTTRIENVKSFYNIIKSIYEFQPQLKDLTQCFTKPNTKIIYNILQLLDLSMKEGVDQLKNFMEKNQKLFEEHVSNTIGDVCLEYLNRHKTEYSNEWEIFKKNFTLNSNSIETFNSNNQYNKVLSHKRRINLKISNEKEINHQSRMTMNEKHWQVFSEKSWNELKQSIGLPLTKPHVPLGDYELDTCETSHRIRLRIKRTFHELGIKQNRIGEIINSVPSPKKTPNTPDEMQSDISSTPKKLTKMRSTSFSSDLASDLIDPSVKATSYFDLPQLNQSEGERQRKSDSLNMNVEDLFSNIGNDPPNVSSDVNVDLDLTDLDLKSESDVYADENVLKSRKDSMESINSETTNSSKSHHRRIVKHTEDQLTPPDETVQEPVVEESKMNDFEQKINPFVRPTDKIYKHFNCMRIEGMNPIPVLLLLTETDIYTIDGFKCSNCQGSAECKTHEVPNVEHICRRFNYYEIRSIQQRKYELREVSLELFLSQGYSINLVFQSKGEREKIQQQMLEYYPLDQLIKTSEQILDLVKVVTEKWIRREISNFDYLILLNLYAGRSFNDLTQYLVFPWIISDYESETIDLNNPSVYRDLSKPMGAINREDQFRERYENLVDMDPNPFHYGTHYSTGPIVLYYLTRLQPYASALVSFQNGMFDAPSRMFQSIYRAWSSSSGQGTNAKELQDVKELIPEFFCLPHFLQNVNRYPLGTVNDENINDVLLPPWAKKNSREFIRINRLALESEYVSDHLNEWIDLIFGYKQRGKEAEKACNVFYYLTYDGAVDPDKLNDPAMRESILLQIREFGQTPSQLFNQPHPHRSPKGPIPKFGDFTQQLDTRIIHEFIRKQAVGKSDIKSPFTHPRNLISRLGALMIVNQSILGLPQKSCFVGTKGIFYLAWGYTDHCMRLFPLNPPEIGEIEYNCMIMECLDSYDVLCCSFSPSSERMVVAYENNSINVFDFDAKSKNIKEITMEHLYSLYGHTDTIFDVKVCPDFGCIFSVSENECIMWDLFKGEYLLSLEHENERIRCFDVNSETGEVIICTATHIIIHDVNGFQIAKTETKEKLNISKCLITQDINYNLLLITGCDDGKIILWVVEMEESEYIIKQKEILKYHDCLITSLTMNEYFILLIHVDIHYTVDLKIQQ